ncbi:hypothetical protein C1H71_15700 [Iodobacter fluviatilis]|uniref:Uncharacterized protein n=1 Tax=Iodobacter fluviatilis TaxID=537 RepID=A0A7G3GBP8_9NEIS|nr:hypothetical protein C1H71_15700 [Iodobacter fluviatilis]
MVFASQKTKGNSLCSHSRVVFFVELDHTLSLFYKVFFIHLCGSVALIRFLYTFFMIWIFL